MMRPHKRYEVWDAECKVPCLLFGDLEGGGLPEQTSWMPNPKGPRT